MRRPFSLLIPCCLALVAGCGDSGSYHAPGFTLAADAPVAIIPFDALSGNPNAGVLLARLLHTELAATRCCKLLPGEQVEHRLAPLAGKNLAPKELAKLLGARYLLLGSVTEYRYKRGIAQEPVIGLNLRLLDPATGAALWSSTRDRVGRHSWLREDSLSRLAQAMCRRIALDFASAVTGSERHE